MSFTLDPRLAEESVVLTDWRLCQVLLRDEHRFAWLVLVPRRDGLTELCDLTAEDQARAMHEIALASRALLDATDAEKINVGALGNIVSQLHIHVVGRRRDDPAWPGPVWGYGTRTPYEPGGLTAMTDRLGSALRTPSPAFHTP